jgi:hypothetical protein
VVNHIDSFESFILAGVGSLIMSAAVLYYCVG